MSDLYLGGLFFFSSRRRHTRWTGDWSSDVCSSDLTTVILKGFREAFTNEQLERGLFQRSEERRVGKECRSRWSAYQEKKNSETDCGALCASIQEGTLVPPMLPRLVDRLTGYAVAGS